MPDALPVRQQGVARLHTHGDKLLGARRTARSTAGNCQTAATHTPADEHARDAAERRKNFDRHRTNVENQTWLNRMVS